LNIIRDKKNNMPAFGGKSQIPMAKFQKDSGAEAPNPMAWSGVFLEFGHWDLGFSAEGGLCLKNMAKITATTRA
jgi:hypothetical protein